MISVSCKKALVGHGRTVMKLEPVETMTEADGKHK